MSEKQTLTLYLLKSVRTKFNYPKGKPRETDGDDDDDAIQTLRFVNLACCMFT